MERFPLKFIFVSMGLLLIGGGLLASPKSPVESEGSMPSEMAFFESRGEGGEFANPEFSYWEKALCFGYKSASFCPDRPLHPYLEHYLSEGKEISQPTKPKRVTTVQYDNLVR